MLPLMPDEDATALKLPSLHDPVARETLLATITCCECKTCMQHISHATSTLWKAPNQQLNATQQHFLEGTQS